MTPSPATEDLLPRALAGDREARAALYQAVAPTAHATIRRLIGTRATAEDLFQDTMLTFFEHLPNYRAEAPLAAWLRQIAISKCLMHLRSPWHRARLELECLDIEPAQPPTDPEALDIERALATLTPTARAVVWLYEVEGYSHEEIARAFNRSVSFSKSQLARAHRKLREWYEPAAGRPSCIPT